MAQYRELAAFAQFASDLDEVTRNQIKRGQRVTELMKQPQYHPLSIAEISVSLFAANEGFIDDIVVNKVSAFELVLLSNMKSQYPDLMSKINETGEFGVEISEVMRSAIDKIKKTSNW